MHFAIQENRHDSFDPWSRSNLQEEDQAMKSDEIVQLHVLEELDWESSINAAQIGVTVASGVVTLTGHVPTYGEKLTAEEVAKRVHGVKKIASEIEVRPAEGHQRDDAEIAGAALRALEWDAKTPHDRIQVIVRNGWITLGGTVEHRFQKIAADRAVRHLVGVRGVTNGIVVESNHTPERLKTGIEAALRRSATVNSKKVCIAAEGGAVVLSGDVHSFAERDEAERICWRARGVSQVENCITVTPWGQGPAEEWGY
jgi:osmotically-inducible protein OsmY